jgi:hypothetical protein
MYIHTIQAFLLQQTLDGHPPHPKVFACSRGLAFD